MNNDESIGGVLKNLFGALSETAGAAKDLASVTRMTVSHGVTLNQIADRNLKSWDRLSTVRNEISYAKELAELQNTAKELGIEMPEI